MEVGILESKITLIMQCYNKKEIMNRTYQARYGGEKCYLKRSNKIAKTIGKTLLALVITFFRIVQIFVIIENNLKYAKSKSRPQSKRKDFSQLIIEILVSVIALSCSVPFPVNLENYSKYVKRYSRAQSKIKRFAHLFIEILLSNVGHVSENINIIYCTNIFCESNSRARDGCTPADGRLYSTHTERTVNAAVTLCTVYAGQVSEYIGGVRKMKVHSVGKEAACEIHQSSLYIKCIIDKLYNVKLLLCKITIRNLRVKWFVFLLKKKCLLTRVYNRNFHRVYCITKLHCRSNLTLRKAVSNRESWTTTGEFVNYYFKYYLYPSLFFFYGLLWFICGQIVTYFYIR